MSGMTAASRIVVKIGSSSLTREDGGLDLNRIDAVARLVSRWRGRDREVVIVSSGAVAAGLDPLGFSAKPKDLPSVQAAAAMGQGLLIARWTAAFQAHHLDAAQVLLTTDDVMRRDHYTNVRAALSRRDHCRRGSCEGDHGRQEVSAGCWRALGARSFRGRGRCGRCQPDRTHCARRVRLRFGHTGPDRRRGYGTAGGGRIRASQASNSPRRPGGVR